MKITEMEIPKPVSKEECDRLFAEYVKTKSPEIKEKIFYGSLFYLEKAVQYAERLNEKIISKEDLFATCAMLFYERFIDGYAAKIATNNFPYNFATYLKWQIRGTVFYIQDAKRNVFHSKMLSWEDVCSRTLSDGQTTILDTLAAPYDDMESSIAKIDYERFYAAHVEKLSDVAKKILKERILENKTYDEIAKELKVSRQRVYEIFRLTIKKLRKVCPDYFQE